MTSGQLVTDKEIHDDERSISRGAVLAMDEQFAIGTVTFNFQPSTVDPIGVGSNDVSGKGAWN